MISVLMPVRNASPFLKECLESIINQSINDWELVAVNDHSTDESYQILKDHSEFDSRIRIYNNEGEGIIDALKLAYTHSKGQLISRMDADDLMHKQKLELLQSEHGKQPESIITSYVSYFSDQTLGEGYKKYEGWLNSLIDQQSHYSNVYKECVLPSPNWLMSRNTLELLGGFKGLEYPEDYDLCFKAYKNGVSLVGIKEVLHHWRDYPTRTSRTDENYSDNAFLPLKVRYFLDVDRDTSTPLVLWGAGSKGKKIAQLLIDKNITFQWATNNPKKIGVQIYAQLLKDEETILALPSAQLIIAVAGPSDQIEIRDIIKEKDGFDSFWFC